MSSYSLKNDIYEDTRGYVGAVWREKDSSIKYVEDRISCSSFGTVRGFHGDLITDKLCVCLYGTITMVVFDLDSQQTDNYFLSSPRESVFVPKRHVMAYQCLSKDCVLLYKWTQYYTSPEQQITINYQDETIGAKWLNLPIIVSDRDKYGQSLKDFYKTYVR